MAHLEQHVGGRCFISELPTAAYHYGSSVGPEVCPWPVTLFRKGPNTGWEARKLSGVRGLASSS